jgi:uncharacterized phage protein gp47/JayE
MRSRSEEEITRQMVQAITNLDAVADASSGPILDLAVTPQATQLAFLESLIAYASKLRSLGNAAELDPADLDEFGATFGVERGLGAYARGVVRFERTSPPNADILIPAGTVVGVPNTQLAYVTESPVTMYKSLAPSYYDPSRNRWSIESSVIATKPGASYNVGVGKIKSLGNNISGIDSVYNASAISGGRDIQTNTEFASVLVEVLSGTDRSSEAGTSREVRKERPEIVDVAVFSGSDPEILRVPSAVPRDIYVTGGIPVQASDSFTYMATGAPHVFLKQPVVALVGVYNTSTGARYTSGTDYALTADTSNLSGSIYASDILTIPVGSTITNATPLTVVYTYDSSVSALQEYFLKDENKIAGVDTVVFSGKRKYVYVSISVTALTGYSIQQLRTDITYRLSTVLNTYKFGDGVTLLSPSDIRLDLLNNVSGISTLVFTRFSDGPSPDVVESISVGRNEYTYIDTSTIVWS